MGQYFVAKKTEEGMIGTPTILLEDPQGIRIADHPIRIKILELLSENPYYPSEIAKKLKMHEQNVYYHLKQLDNAGFVEVVERKNIRGTTAKKYRAKELCFSVALKTDWTVLKGYKAKSTDKNLDKFLKPFMKSGVLDAKIVVGSPDPHGPHKASARDGHYAIDLALFLGRFMDVPTEFSANLDVDVHLINTDSNLIIVGGPVTNLVGSEINGILPVKFSDEPPWGLVSKRTDKTYTAENIGIISRLPNPYHNKRFVLYIAGIRGVGTKSAVLALTREHKTILQTFNEQEVWSVIVQGFDLDGDGKIDSIELVE